MKKTFMTLAILACLSLTTLAAPKAGLLEDNKKGKGGELKELNLSKEQKSEVKTIKADFKQKIQAVKNSRIAPEMQKTKIEILRTEQEAAIGKVLTADQHAKLKAAESMMRGNKHGDKGGKKHGHGMMNTRGGIWMLAGIDLTEAQQAQYKAIAEKHQEENKAVSEKFKKEKKAIDDKHKKSINDILTPAQQAVFKENNAKISGKSCCSTDLDDVTKAKVESLKETYEKEKSAIERSRIAPEMQKMKLGILKEKFDTDLKDLLDSAE